MSTELTVLAIGPYSHSILRYLDYPTGVYKNLNPGDTVMTTALYLTSRQQCMEVAETLGGNIYDASTWKLRDIDSNVDWQELANLVGHEDCASFMVLVREGFRMWLRPDF